MHLLVEWEGKNIRIAVRRSKRCSWSNWSPPVHAWSKVAIVTPAWICVLQQHRYAQKLTSVPALLVLKRLVYLDLLNSWLGWHVWQIGSADMLNSYAQKMHIICKDGKPALHLLQANHRLASFTAVAVEVLSMWLRTVLDDGKRNALKYLTLVRRCCVLHLPTCCCKLLTRLWQSLVRLLPWESIQEQFDVYQTTFHAACSHRLPNPDL